MTTTHPLLSIIIPAYNAQQTLQRAIDSIVMQNDERIEIIIVENGSTDQTTTIAQDYTQQYDNVVLTHSNKGVSNARNQGIALAKGQYITFLDADDLFCPNATEQMLTHINQQNSDLVTYRIQMGMRSTKGTGDILNYEYDTLIDGLVKIIEQPTIYMQACASVYRKTIIDENAITFDTTMHLSEDSDFTLHYLEHVKKITTIDTFLYVCPGDNKNSITRQANKQKVLYMIEALEKTLSKLTIEKKHTRIQEAMTLYLFMNFNVVMVREVYSRLVKETWRNRRKQLNFCRHHPLFSKRFNVVTIQKYGFNIKMWPIILLKYRITFLAECFFVLRSIQNEIKESKG